MIYKRKHFKAKSPEIFWSKIEDIYGEVPELIRLVLEINGFNTFLALKGIRYDDKKEFFSSLEMTVLELLNSEYDSPIKEQLENAIVAAQYYNLQSFKLKPGHRNYIMNLMLEIDRVEVDDFFGRTTMPATNQVATPSKQEQSEEQVYQVTSPQSISRIKLIVPSPVAKAENTVTDNEHEYSQADEADAIDDSEYIFEEEEYLSIDSMDHLGTIHYEYEGTGFQGVPKTKARTSSGTSSSQAGMKRKPNHMYNDDFLSMCINPRRRRVMINKNYPQTDEGTRERFSDLIQQSMQCILPRDQLEEAENSQIEIEKESDISWAVYCPLCHTRVRLAVVRENGGRYCNYKRSNFERHLRFKHCKPLNKNFDAE